MCGMESERGEDFGDGGTDCHGQCSHWPRNDIGFSWGCGVRRGTWAPPYKGFRNIAGGQGRVPLRCCVTKKSVGEGLCPSRGRGNRRSAAGGGCSEPVSRKCPDWRTRQWPGIGWHDGGKRIPPLRKRNKRCNGRATARVAPTITRSAGKESPSHGFAVPAPFRQGGHGDGGTDCHGRGAPSQ